jgi:hypothetical protein
MNFIITKAIVATEIPKREERDPEIVIKKTNIAKKIRKVILNFFLVLNINCTCTMNRSHLLRR